MKLDLDCMRDTLLWLEDREYGEASDAGQMIAALSKYSADTVRYTVQKLNEAEFINADIYGMINGGIEFSVKDITYNGHQFLADVRSPKLWQLCKSNFYFFSFFDGITSSIRCVVTNSLHSFISSLVGGVQPFFSK